MLKELRNGYLIPNQVNGALNRKLATRLAEVAGTLHYGPINMRDAIHFSQSKLMVFFYKSNGERRQKIMIWMYCIITRCIVSSRYFWPIYEHEPHFPHHWHANLCIHLSWFWISCMHVLSYYARRVLVRGDSEPVTSESLWSISPLFYLFEMSPSIAAIVVVICSIWHFSIATSIVAVPNLFIKHILKKIKHCWPKDCTSVLCQLTKTKLDMHKYKSA